MLNKVLIVGRLGKDPELKYTASGSEMCTFSMATSESYTNKDGQKKDRTDWHNLIAWGTMAKICSEHLAKGALAFIEGKLTTSSWEDKSGNKRQTTQIQVISMVKLADGKGGTPKTKNQVQDNQVQDSPVGGQSAEEDIPF